MTVDVPLSVTVSRETLGLQPLEIATDPNYFCTTQFLGAAVQWQRQQVTSQWLDGGVTTARHRGMVTEQIAVEIRADNLGSLQILMNALIAAFIQDLYRITVQADNALHQYICESADYQDMSWTTPRMAGVAGQLLFQVPRQPVPTRGTF